METWNYANLGWSSVCNLGSAERGAEPEAWNMTRNDMEQSRQSLYMSMGWTVKGIPFTRFSREA
ncbi:hypothetical protein [Paenibacillus pabuli]|uniref:hypothetical protein n=1 Tax=Paenibacillus pabuli TaxID=1472 RepID=UPI003CEC0E19